MITRPQFLYSKKKLVNSVIIRKVPSWNIGWGTALRDIVSEVLTTEYLTVLNVLRNFNALVNYEVAKICTLPVVRLQHNYALLGLLHVSALCGP